MDVTAETGRWIQIGDHRMIRLKDNIVLIRAIGPTDDELVAECEEVASSFAKNIEQPCHYLIDLNKAGKQSPRARRLWQGLSQGEKVDKVALFGLHPVARVMASFVMGISKRDNVRFFKTEDQAMLWLSNQ